MKILILGSGGREHALAWKIAQSKLADKIFCAPGNGGISQNAECLDLKADDIPAIVDFVRSQKIDFTVVGPEAPLAAGIADEFAKYKLNIFAPKRSAAQLEASKIFAKQLMAKYKVPTAGFQVFDNLDKANQFIEKMGAPCVVKADGLAQGKGVVVAKTVDEAKQAAASMLQGKIFGEAGAKIIVEDCLEGQEASILVFTDSKQVIPLASSQDHKRVFDNDEGPNTGGMGAYSPAPVVSEAVFKQVIDEIIYRAIGGMAKEGIDYRGVLYAGVMLTKEGPKALEFNVRFGDPETQAVLPRLKSDLLEVMLATSSGNLTKFFRLGGLSWDSRPCVCVVCAAEGYPGNYSRGKQIFGLDEAAKLKDTMVFHAGTKLQKPETSSQKPGFFTNGGRVLGVTGLGSTIEDAVNKTYAAVNKINFEGIHFRKDIGARALKM